MHLSTLARCLLAIQFLLSLIILHISVSLLSISVLMLFVIPILPFHETDKVFPADRRPIDPPPVVQLRVTDKRKTGSTDDSELCVLLTFASYNCVLSQRNRPHPSSYLQNPYYFMYASLASPETDEELHLLKDGKTRCTTGSVVSSLYCLKDPEATGGELCFLQSLPDVQCSGRTRFTSFLFTLLSLSFILSHFIASNC